LMSTLARASTLPMAETSSGTAVRLAGTARTATGPMANAGRFEAEEQAAERPRRATERNASAVARNVPTRGERRQRGFDTKTLRVVSGGYRARLGRRSACLEDHTTELSAYTYGDTNRPNSWTDEEGGQMFRRNVVRRLGLDDFGSRLPGLGGGIGWRRASEY
jgi:hypothetical protein